MPAKPTLSTLDLLKSFGTGLLKKGADMAGAEAGELLVNSLKLLVGWPDQQKEDREQLIQWMKSVDRSLGEIQVQVGRIDSLVKDTKLTVDKTSQWQAYRGQYDRFVGDWKVPIDTAFKLFKEAVQAYLDGGDRGKEKAEAKIGELERYLERQDLPTIVHTLANFWGVDPFPNSTNILESLNDTCVLSLASYPKNFRKYYDSLESNLLLGVEYMLKAYAVLTAVRALEEYRQGSGKINEPAVRTYAWLREQSDEYFRPVIENFLACAERLTLATFDPLSNPRGISIEVSSVQRKVFARADLIAWLVLSYLYEGGPGFLGRAFLPPSALRADPNFALVGDGVRLDGKRQQPVAKYNGGSNMAYWYKVADWTEDGLLSWEMSDVVALRYGYEKSVPIPPGTLGQKVELVDPLGVAVVVEPRLYDKVTLEEVTEASATTVELAPASFHRLTASGTEINSEAAFRKYGSTDVQAVVAASDDYGVKKSSAEANREKLRGEVVLTDMQAAPFYQDKHYLATYTFELPYLGGPSESRIEPPATSGSVKSGAVLVHSIHLEAHVDDYHAAGAGRRAGDVIVRMRMEAGGEKIPLYERKFESDSDYRGHLDLAEEENLFALKAARYIRDGRLYVTLVPGERTRLVWEVDFFAQKYDFGWGARKNDLKGTLSQMRYRIAWVQPQLGFN